MFFTCYSSLDSMRDFKKSIWAGPNSEKNGRSHKVWPHVFRVILALVTTGVIVLLFPLSSIYQSLDLPAVGGIANEEIIAPFTFPVLKSKEELEEDRKLVLANLPVILDFDRKKGDSVMSSVGRFFAVVDSVNESNQIPESRRRDFRLLFPYLEEEGIFLLSSDEGPDRLAPNLIVILKELYQVGMVQDVQSLPFSEGGGVVIVDKSEKTEDSTHFSRILNKDELLDLSQAKERLLSLAMVKFEDDQLTVKALYEVGSRFLVPNLSLDPKAMETQKTHLE